MNKNQTLLVSKYILTGKSNQSVETYFQSCKISPNNRLYPNPTTSCDVLSPRTIGANQQHHMCWARARQQ